jgi:hypothetical protein
VASYNSTSPRLVGLSYYLGELSILDCGNDNLLNMSVDNVFVGYSQLAQKSIGCSKIHFHENKSLWYDRNRARAPYLSLAGDKEHFLKQLPLVFFLTHVIICSRPMLMEIFNTH